MTESLLDTNLAHKAEALLAKTQEFEEDHRQQISELAKQCDDLFEAATKITASWSGSYFGYHSELYYGNFERPQLGNRFSPEWGGIHGIPPGWKSREPDEVKTHLELLAKAQFRFIDEKTKQLVREAQALQTEIVVGLSPLHGKPGFDKERALLDQIEQLQWEKKVGEYVQANLPKNFMSRDSTAVAEGVRVPAHLYYQALANECGSRCTAIGDFLKLSRRFLSQMQNQLANAGAGEEREASNPLSSVTVICKRFHSVARQLQNRRQGRPTLDIHDEYDVQNLLHSLLRLHFDDIRPEEWTPSYAGGAARMDFLLKAEGIVLEAKMTRTGRAGKEVSEELIIDAARYKTHPDCKTLVCFIYDPDGLIKNPRGVESDLASLSAEPLKVIAIIAP